MRFNLLGNPKNYAAIISLIAVRCRRDFHVSRLHHLSRSKPFSWQRKINSMHLVMLVMKLGVTMYGYSVIRVCNYDIIMVKTVYLFL